MMIFGGGIVGVSFNLRRIGIEKIGWSFFIRMMMMMMIIMYFWELVRRGN